MKEPQEQGFLSQKFDDWSSEPIPNGWAKIDSIIEKDRKKRPFFWWLFPVAFLTSGIFSYLGHQIRDWGAPNNLNATSSVKELLSQYSTAKTEDLKKNAELISMQEIEEEKSFSPENARNSDSGNASEKPEEFQNLPTLGAEKANMKPISRSGAFTTTLVNATANPGKNKKGGIVLSQEISQTTRNKSELSSEENSPESVENFVDLFSTNQQPSSLQTSEKGFENREIEYLSEKQAQLSLLDLKPGEPRYLIIKPPLQKRKPDKVLFFYVGASTGYASRDFFINQKEALHTLKIQESGQKLNAWFSQLETGVQIQILPWIQVLTGGQFGIFRQKIRLENTSKLQSENKIVQVDSTENYRILPENAKWDEIKTQELVFGNFEFGIKPIFFKDRQSGPFASLLLWTSLEQSQASTLPGGSPFMKAKSIWALGYRFGYQHLVSNRWNLQVFTSELPQDVLAQSQGLKVNPRFFGIGLQYVMR
jgi:hypothetical protein